MRISINVGVPGLETAGGSAAFRQYTLDLDFLNEVYEVYEYSELDLSLNLDFANQVFQSE